MEISRSKVAFKTFKYTSVLPWHFETIDEKLSREDLENKSQSEGVFYKNLFQDEAQEIATFQPYFNMLIL
jgi:hypothetical protein